MNKIKIGDKVEYHNLVLEVWLIHEVNGLLLSNGLWVNAAEIKIINSVTRPLQDSTSSI